ncbi:MAG: histidinol-phosphatase HisJ family protein [Candidatus Lokiarchaeota archaeon]|nr:histidinol-phosphatase HisJ family protein [Candidatus Lokiarchaeota archaeon]
MKYKYTDYHIHTRWSHDIAKNGPSFEDYAIIAEKRKINICFLDHYEFYYIENDPNYPFYGIPIEDYLNEIDKIKQTYNNVLSGLEIDYYSEYKTEIQDFVDDYEKDFDFLAGTLHETDYGYPFTTRSKLISLLEKKKIKQILDEFFILSKEMIESKIFKNICHLDTIYRYINSNDLKPTYECDLSDDRILKLGRKCIKNNTRIEYNLSGIRYPIGRPFPSPHIIALLIKEGAEVFVGSDSHSVNYFSTQINNVKKTINNLEAIRKGSCL